MKTRILIALLLLPTMCLADAMLPSPSTQIARSPNKRFFAQTNPHTNTTTVYRAGKRPVRLWKMADWFRSLFVCDDGQHLVAAYDGLNALELSDVRPQTVMLRFFERNRLVRAVTLGELRLNQGNLRRSESHFFWGTAQGFDKRGRFEVETVDGRHLFFDVRMGRSVR